MPEQTFGGDDDKNEQQPAPKPRIKLDRFASKPDANLRDVFWEVMAAYATKREPVEQLKKLENEKVPVLLISLGILTGPESGYGLSKNRIAEYTLKMMLDTKWHDLLEELIIKSYEHKNRILIPLVVALKRLSEQHVEIFSDIFRKMLRSYGSTSAILAYLAEMKNKNIIKLLKKELLIIAKGDIENNQINAMVSLSMLIEDEDVRNTLAALLSHWSESTREMAVILLQKNKDLVMLEAIKRQAAVETSPHIKKMMEKIAAKADNGIPNNKKSISGSGRRIPDKKKD